MWGAARTILVASGAYVALAFAWIFSRRSVVVYSILRVAFWSLGIAVALMPAINASNADYSLSVEDMALATNAAGFFRDFFFITVVAGILGLSNILDALFKNDGRTNLTYKLIDGLLAVYFIAIIAYGVNRFGVIAASKGPIATSNFGHDFSIIRFTLLAGVVTEISIALRERNA